MAARLVLPRAILWRGPLHIAGPAVLRPTCRRRFATEAPRRVALVTGSTSGIGLGIAKSLAAAGHDIVLNGFLDNSGHAERLVQEVSAVGGRAWHVDADLRTAAGCGQLVAETVRLAGGLSVLVNNAGVQRTHPIDEFPDETWDLIISVNLSAVFHMTKAAMPHLHADAAGRIINVASVHGLVGSKQKSAYVASKHGVIGLTKVVALETAETPVTCNVICPGWVLTPLVQQQIDDLAAREGITVAEAQARLIGEKMPSKEPATVEQLGQLAVFLASPAAQQCRGASFVMDGAWTAQ